MILSSTQNDERTFFRLIFSRIIYMEINICHYLAPRSFSFLSIRMLSTAWNHLVFFYICWNPLQHHEWKKAYSTLYIRTVPENITHGSDNVKFENWCEEKRVVLFFTWSGNEINLCLTLPWRCVLISTIFFGGWRNNERDGVVAGARASSEGRPSKYPSKYLADSHRSPAEGSGAD